KAHDHYRKRNALQNRWVALKITLLISLLFLFSLILIVLGQEFITLISHLVHIHSKATQLALNVLRYILTVLMFFFSISLIYYYGPNTKKKYKFISTGATVATILSILVSI